jgi:hypothetical protein
VTRRRTPAELRDGWEDGWPYPSAVGRFLEAVRDGDTASTAALINELEPATVASWAEVGAVELGRAGGVLARIPRGGRPYATFASELARAEAQSESRMVGIITRHAQDSEAPDRWRAAAWILEHHRRAAPPRPVPDTSDDVTDLSTPVRDGAD